MAEDRQMHQQAAQVVATEHVAEDVIRLRLFADKVAQQAKPGQFVHVRIGTDREYILRRPFSVHAVSGQTLDLLFDVKGRATRSLSRARVHDVLDVIGPLGRGFSIPANAKQALLVAGGMGIAPLAMLAEELWRRKIRVYVALGARTKARVIELVELKRLAREVVVTTDDGTMGERARVTDVVGGLIGRAKPDIVYGCGPEVMLAKLAKVVQPYELRCEVSLERLMACGVGACLSCAVRTTEGIERACAEGPVFDASRVVWQW
jgi:dihydroorotate dehydrogenase electron transfer subunit